MRIKKLNNGFSFRKLRDKKTRNKLTIADLEISRNGHEYKEHQPDSNSPSQIKLLERLAALLVLVIWLNLFASGILIGSERYRLAIDPAGVKALKGTNDKTQVANVAVEQPVSNEPNVTIGPYKAWFMALITFLPFNLALLCAAAGALGAFGNRVNLQDDRLDLIAHDRSNPYVSALLRGFFVYLFMISGLLLIDDRPFADSSPQQYVRLAGFLSLFSFAVNYNPYIFNPLIEWAYQRIQPRTTSSLSDSAAVSLKVEKVEKTTEREKKTVATGEASAAPLGPKKADQMSQ
jgi:hypothetical protein